METIFQPATSCLPPQTLSGRWCSSPDGSLVAGWAGASAEFLLEDPSSSPSALKCVVGPRTERKDKWNGGIPMLAVHAQFCSDGHVPNDGDHAWVTLNTPQPHMQIDLYELATSGRAYDKWAPLYVRIVLIDWASCFELLGFEISKTAQIKPVDGSSVTVSTKPQSSSFQRILCIGDSMSTGFVLEDAETLPLGCLNAIPLVAERKIRQKIPRFCVDLVAFPGWTLVAPTEVEKNQGLPAGMSEAYFNISPWLRAEATDMTEVSISTPSAVFIALGTNDQGLEITPQRFCDALLHFIERLFTSFDTLPQYVWIVPPYKDANDDSEQLTSAFDAIIESLARGLEGRTTVELCDLPQSIGNSYTTDGLHLNLKGNEIGGAKLAEFIESHFE